MYLIRLQYTCHKPSIRSLNDDAQAVCDINSFGHCKTRATEQRWASELAAFDLLLIIIRYRPGSQNMNADALSRQYESPGQACGTPCVELQGYRAPTIQMEKSALPGCSQVDLVALQKQDPVIGPFLRHWKVGRAPEPKERNILSKGTKELIHQWGQIKESDSVVYRRI